MVFLVRQLLYAYGDTTPHHSFPQEPNNETVRVLDEVVTDFIIETCHEAAQVASYAGRQKVKVDDFRFTLRRDPIKLGRVQELFRLERELKEARRAFDQNDDRVGSGLKDAAKAELGELAETDGGGDDENIPIKESASSGKRGKGKTKTKTRKRRTSAGTAAMDVFGGKKRKIDPASSTIT